MTSSIQIFIFYFFILVILVIKVYSGWVGQFFFHIFIVLRLNEYKQILDFLLLCFLVLLSSLDN